MKFSLAQKVGLRDRKVKEYKIKYLIEFYFIDKPSERSSVCGGYSVLIFGHSSETNLMPNLSGFIFSLSLSVFFSQIDLLNQNFCLIPPGGYSLRAYKRGSSALKHVKGG